MKEGGREREDENVIEEPVDAPVGNNGERRLAISEMDFEKKNCVR